jgi:hypothetical protein
MSYDDLPALTPESFDEFMARVRNDEDLRQSLIDGIEAEGFVATLEKHFTLSADQQELLAGLRAAGGAWDQQLLLALRQNGQIEIFHEGRNSVDVELDVSIPFVGEMHVGIHC